MTAEPQKNPEQKVKSATRGHAVVRIVWALVTAFIFFLGYSFFIRSCEPPLVIKNLTEKDITYIVEQQSKVLELVLVKRTITGTVAKDYTKDFHFNIPIRGEKVFEFSAHAEVKCPVTYAYYADLAAEWKITARNGIVRVQAPPIQVGKPQIDTAEMQEYFQGSTLIFNKQEILAEVRKSVTPGLTELGERHKKIAYIREDCRRQLAGFIRTWAMNHVKVEEVIVRFADDPDIQEQPGILERDESDLEIRVMIE
ncbi:DUF4230 domain-containing protein [candidate division KSB1 bacterium]|nr:DUF4230 domain-containing protein [candidate division KSB1 bacterium]